MPEVATDNPGDGSYTASFGDMASQASRATASIAGAAREKLDVDTRIAGQQWQRGEEDRARSVEALKKTGIGPEEFKPWNAEIEHKKYESDPLQGFASSGAVFAMIASAFTKAPMLSAIEGMAGALNGIKKGEEDAYLRAFDSYKENIKTAKIKHEIEHQAYTDALALGTHDLALSNAKLRAEATRFGDKQILALADNGMVKEIYDAVSARNNAMESASSLAEKTTVRTMQKRTLETSFAEIDKQQGPPGPDGQPTPVPDNIKAAQKLKLFNTVMASGKLGTPQQQAMAQLIMENPTMPVEEMLGKAAKLNIIKQTKAEIQKEAVTHIVDARAQELLTSNPDEITDMSAARKRARKELGVSEDGMQITSKTSSGIAAQLALQEAVRKHEENPEISVKEFFDEGVRKSKIMSSAPSGNRVDDLRKLNDEADNAITKSEKALSFLEKYKGGAGLIGKIMRGEEIATNIVGLSTRSDRVQFRRDVLSLQEMVGRVVTQANGRPLKSAQEKAAAVVAGLESGDTGPNTRRAYRDLIEELKKRKKDIQGRITGGFDPDKRSSGADDDSETPPPAVGGKKPPANWLDMYPKK